MHGETVINLEVLSPQKVLHVSVSGTFVQFSDVIISLHGEVLEKLIAPQGVTQLSKMYNLMSTTNHSWKLSSDARIHHMSSRTIS
jgi:hypothetical protein